MSSVGGEPIRVLVVDDDALVRKAVTMILGTAGDLEVVAAVRQVHAGLPALSPGATQTLIDTLVDTASAGGASTATPKTHLTDALTDREREVAVLLAGGYTNAEIGDKLFMALATVKANVTRILTQLGVDNRVSAAMIIRDEGLT